MYIGIDLVSLQCQPCIHYSGTAAGGLKGLGHITRTMVFKMAKCFPNTRGMRWRPTSYEATVGIMMEKLMSSSAALISLHRSTSAFCPGKGYFAGVGAHDFKHMGFSEAIPEDHIYLLIVGPNGVYDKYLSGSLCLIFQNTTGQSRRRRYTKSEASTGLLLHNPTFWNKGSGNETSAFLHMGAPFNSNNLPDNPSIGVNWSSIPQETGHRNVIK